MEKSPVVPKKFLIPFILVTILFPLWAFANNFTDPFVKVFKDVFNTSNDKAAWVQMAFYGGYATMAIPAAIFIRKFSYKAGILVGLLLFAAGALITIPAAQSVNFTLFIFAFYILTFGLAFLETTANPFILSMGSEKTATRRLNLAQAFNPIGSLVGAGVAAAVVLPSLDMAAFKHDVGSIQAELSPAESSQTEHYILPFLKHTPKENLNDPNVRNYLENTTVEDPAKLTEQTITAYQNGEIATFDGKSFVELQQHDLSIASTSYTILGITVLAVFLIFVFYKVPEQRHEKGEALNLGATAKRLFANSRYLGGVVAQIFYVGVQIMVWTYIFHYCENELGIDNATAGKHQIAALVLFLGFRFVCTFFLKYISPGKLLALLSVGGIATTLGAIYLSGMPGLYSLMGISACMSLMFPTIYGIALEGVGEDAKLGSAGLIFAIVGGAFMPKLQGMMIDSGDMFGLSATRASFYLPVLCFVIIAIYGLVFRSPRPEIHMTEPGEPI
ncbi:MFS transporter [Oceaniferula spumae]|uniref:MFS transporter n=1 Tax=Oceaniferula spumae TaxID=2979115 RepID=A0AAT9FM05_9BACT